MAVCRTGAILLAVFTSYFRMSQAHPIVANAVLVAASVYNTALLLAYLRNKTFKGMRIAAVAVDMAFVTLWVYLAIPESTRLFGLYYVLVVVAALWLGVIGTTVTAAAGALLYLLALYAGGADPATVERAATQQIPVLVLAAVVAGYMAQAQRAERVAWDRDRVALAEYESRRKIVQEFYDRLTPKQLPSLPGLEVGLRFRPALRMGAGDYYDLLTIRPGRYLAFVGDVSGKYAGSLIPAWFFKASLLAITRALQSPGRILAQVNDNWFPEAAEEVDRVISLCCVVIDPEEHRFSYSSAGHDPPLLIRQGSREAVSLECGGLVIGVQPGVTYEEEDLPLEPGDTLVLYTDGATEASDAAGNHFGLEGLKAAAVAGVALGLSADRLAHQLFTRVREFARGGHRDDDMTLMVLRVLPRPASGD